MRNMTYVLDDMRPQDFLSLEEFGRLKAACKDERELAIIMTLGGTGIRVNELCHLKVEDIDFERGYLHVEVAKGSRPRTVVCSKNALEALGVHLHGRKSEAGYVFVGRHNGHTSTRQVQRILDELAIKAGLQDTRQLSMRSRKRITPHLLRHSAAIWWLDAGIPVSDVQSQLGHASLATTGLYLQRRPNHRRESFRRAGVDGMI
ncbi:MAG: site-specific integrase [Methanotrichaceae archaeon]|nr:site-specific integrase [Methanotrichaceae archaeon]